MKKKYLDFYVNKKSYEKKIRYGMRKINYKNDFPSSIRIFFKENQF